MKFLSTPHRSVEVDGGHWVHLTNSASILRLDPLSHRLLATFAGESGRELEDGMAHFAGDHPREELHETLQEMVAMGLLRPEGERLPPQPLTPPMPFPIASLVLNVTNKCNLSCTYCYEYGEDRIAEPKKADGSLRKSMMTLEVARESIDFLFRSSASQRRLSVTFFGGETLLNFDVVKEAVRYARDRAREEKRQINFSLTTNATLLDDAVIDFLIEHRFGINISIDGAREDQDRHRRFHSGKGSYDVILPRITKLLAKAKSASCPPIGARVTLTRGTTGVRSIFRHLSEEVGFEQVGFAPVTSGAGTEYDLGSIGCANMLEEFSALSEELVTEAIAGRPHAFSNMNDLLRELHQGANKAHPCGAGLGLLGVSTEGELGLCHRFVESGEHSLGDVREGVDETRRKDFLEKGHISTKHECSSCFARPLCSGGCYHEALVHQGDATVANLHYCDWIRSWTDLGLRSYARIAATNPSFFSRFEDRRPAASESRNAESTQPSESPS